MTLTTLRSAGPGRSTQTPGSTPHGHKAQFTSALGHGARRGRRAPAHTVRSQQGTGPVWSLLLPSYRTNNPTEEAMPDQDAGPSHEPGARILGGPS
jgi:hypothetical protein